MKQIRAVATGTYYPPRAEAANGAEHVRPMRGLVYLVKANRMPPEPSWINNPAHPGGQAVLLRNQAEACAYLAEIVEAKIDRIRDNMGWGNTPLAFVPLPSSSVTRDTVETARWPARELARELERRGLGAARICVVNALAGESKIGGVRVPPSAIARNTVAMRQVPPGELPVYVDDVITRGERLAGTDHVLCPHRQSAAFVVAFTEAFEARDCYRARKMVVSYDATATPWRVVVSQP